MLKFTRSTRYIVNTVSLAFYWRRSSRDSVIRKIIRKIARAVLRPYKLNMNPYQSFPTLPCLLRRILFSSGY